MGEHTRFFLDLHPTSHVLIPGDPVKAGAGAGAGVGVGAGAGAGAGVGAGDAR